MRPNITILSTGGTIAATSNDNEEGAVPSKSGEELVNAVPEINQHADITVENIAQTPSFNIDSETVVNIGRATQAAVDKGADGIIITQGTDTMEESSYYLDLTLALDTPIVFTGAQRQPEAISSDGPANLLTAVKAASHPEFRGEGGVYIAFNEEIHAARDVIKTHTSKLETFKSPGKGPVATLSRNLLQLHRAPGSRSSNLPILETNRSVTMIKTGIGVSGRQIRDTIDADVDGVIVEGTGLGNTTTAIGDSINEAIQADLPVIITSRSLIGITMPVYGTGGGGQTLADYGAIYGTDLPAHKARIKLMLILEETRGHEEIQNYFDSRI